MSILKNISEYKTICIIGLGYVGLPLLVEFAKKFRVIGYDINKKRISQLLELKDTTNQLNKKNISYLLKCKLTSNKADIKDADIFIISVPTPINKQKKPDLRLLKNACMLVGPYIKDNNIVIFESTVFPGATEEICVPILEKYSKLKCIFNDFNDLKGFYVGYSPERINPGDKKYTLNNIVKVVSGTTPYITRKIDYLYRSIIKAGTYVAPSIRVAEASKVIENSQRDLNIAFVNELSKIFSIMNIDTLDVLKAASTKWNFLNFRPGLVGGHCIGVDPYYLTEKSISIGYKPKVILSGRAVNDSMGKHISNIIKQDIKKNGLKFQNIKVGILGVTFKENCNDIRNTKVIDIIKNLKKDKFTLKMHDPLADKKDFINYFGYRLSDLKEFKNLNYIILAVSHDYYKNISIKKFKSMFKKDSINTIFDVKGMLNRLRFQNANIEMIRL